MRWLISLYEHNQGKVIRFIAINAVLVGYSGKELKKFIIFVSRWVIDCSLLSFNPNLQLVILLF